MTLHDYLLEEPALTLWSNIIANRLSSLGFLGCLVEPGSNYLRLGLEPRFSHALLRFSTVANAQSLPLASNSSHEKNVFPLMNCGESFYERHWYPLLD